MKKLSIVLVVVVIITLSMSGCNAALGAQLMKYSIDASLDDYTLNISEDIHYINNSDAVLDKLMLVSYVGAYTESGNVANSASSMAYPFGVNYANLDINSIEVGGKRSNWRNVDAMYIEVELDKPLKRNKDINITLEYSETIPKNRLRYGYNATSINLGNAFIRVAPYENGDFLTYPYSFNGDPFVSDTASFDVSITCDVDYRAVATSKLASTTNGNKVTYSGSIDNVRDYALVLSSAMNVVSDTHNGVNITYMASDSVSTINIRVAKQCLDVFGKLYGDYPYDNLVIVENDFLEGGMEYPCLVYINNNMDAATLERTIVHELAHQWWYGLVGVDENVDYMIDEGMAELSTYLYYKHNGETAYANALNKKCRDEYTIYTMNYDEQRMSLPLDELSGMEYYAMAYLKAPLLLYKIMCDMGEGDFLDAMRKICAEYKYCRIGMDDFVDAFGFHGNEMREYINGKILE